MNTSDLESIQHANEWLNNHGQPSYEVLKSLSDSGTPEAMETLQQLADKYNISYVQDTTPSELVDKIRLAMRENSENS